MRLKLLKQFTAIAVFATCALQFAHGKTFTTWKFNSLTSISNTDVASEGNPEIIDINKDKAVYFDGEEDRIVVNSNPLIGLDEFTFEVVFRIDKGGIYEQKFIHMQANPDIRILFEIEFVNDSMWYMENYIQSGSGETENIHLMDMEKVHPAGRWYHAAVVYKNQEFKQYINYKLENKASMEWISPEDGTVSVGARMNQVNYMTGAVREVRVADEALESDQFLFYGEMLEESETFILDNLESLNGYDLQVFGNPEVVETEIGRGIAFDGRDDGIYIYTNPIGSSQQFTIETILKPADVYPENVQPRYLHIEDENNSNRRITMELRLNNNHEWYFDGFLRADNNSIGLMEESLTHPIEGWEHMAIVYDNGYFATYVNYEKELEEVWDHVLLPFSDDTKMSVGMRMNRVNYFNGIFQRIRITHAVLESSEFMKINAGGSTSVESVKGSVNINLRISPNPVNKNAEVSFYKAYDGYASLELFTVAGERICQLMQGYYPSGTSTTELDTDSLEKGIYLLRLSLADQVTTEKVLIL